MDLSTLNAGASEGAALHLKSPMDGKPIGQGIDAVTITVISADHPRVRDAVSRYLDEAARDRSGSAVAEAEAAQIGQAVASIVDWTNIEYEGEELAPTTENKRKLMREQLWIREQVLVFSNQRANFIKASPDR